MLSTVQNLKPHGKWGSLKTVQKTNYLLVMLICLVTLGACSSSDDISALETTKSFGDLDEFESYITGDNSPYLQTISKNGIKASLRYMPTDAMMISAYRHYFETQDKLLKDSTLSDEQRNNKLTAAKNELLEWERNFDQSLYFQLTIGYEDGAKDIVYEQMQAGYGVYSQWLQELMFSLQEMIYLQTPTVNEVPLYLYHMERTFGLQKSRTFLLVFPVHFDGQDLLDADNDWLKLRVKEFGLGTGPLTFTFELPLEDVLCESDLSIE